jgi:tyrosine-specific transport protein
MKEFSPFHMLTVVLLITGTTVGAGMLGLPIKTGLSGLLPSLLGMIVVWGLMLATAWILASRIIASDHTTSDLPTLFQQELGTPGKWLSIIGYLTIFYGLLVAYLSGASSIFVNLIKLPLARQVWVIIFFIVVTGIILFGLDLVRKGNAAIMAVLGISFVFLLIKTGQNLNPRHLTYTDWHFIPSALPIIVCAFAFHAIIPTVCRSLKWQSRACWQALLIGTLLALALNALWVLVVIGALPLTGLGQENILAAFHENLPATVPLSMAFHSKVITTAGMFFSLAAIITSYFGVGIAFMGFFRDLIYSFGKKSNRFKEALLTFGPPFLIAILYPNLFLKALDLVGGIGLLLVFGCLPGLMILRPKRKPGVWQRLGGYAILCLFVLLIFLELFQELGWLQIHPNIEYWHFG